MPASAMTSVPARASASCGLQNATMKKLNLPARCQEAKICASARLLPSASAWLRPRCPRMGAVVITVLVIVVSFGTISNGRAGNFSWPYEPTKTFVVRPTSLAGIGEARLYDGKKWGTILNVSLLPWLDATDDLVIVKGACGKASHVLAHLKLEPIPAYDTVNGKPVVLPSPLQETWDYYTKTKWENLVDHGLAVVARTSLEKPKWCGNLSKANEGNPLPAEY